MTDSLAGRNSTPSASTRSAAGRHGAAGPSWPSSPTPSLSVLAATAPHDPGSGADHIIALTRNEIRRFFTSLGQQPTRTRKTSAPVPLATPPRSHSPSLPLPPTRSHSHMITKCRWSTNWTSELHGELPSVSDLKVLAPMSPSRRLPEEPAVVLQTSAALVV
jgi:hypothetical protein